ncbi:helicase-related protein [Dactylococcopsis salina]|uniref:Helicase C-terminal domain-containing protein n=1 Tax=Dactylococcopsis salina (strain PCC 8305) TaxID=13035 RepID=K9YXS3_DACS8|nr:helicase-related protein [Dactylococcopsis salina]AFZ51699.1 hypothetical protein Dacsa_3175 [Dactylococcopsis salina PCC 8305]
MKQEHLGQDLGRLFEVGFNVGMLTYIEQQKIPHNFGDLYRNDLKQLTFSRMLRQLLDQEKVINEKHREMIKKWSLFFLEKSFFAGLNLFSEYLQAMGWNSNKKQKHLEIVYYQCCFCDDNSIGTHLKGKEKANRDVLSQFPDLSVDINKYSDKGEFLNADTLVLMRCQDEWRVLCIDYSIFSIRSIRDLEDMDSMEILRKILLQEVSYLKSKSVFSNLGLDTQATPLDVSESFKRYYLAFKTKDKETIKLIQAASYTHSFSELLREQGIITQDTNITYNILGYSDRNLSAMTLKGENTKILATCSHIYKNEPKTESFSDNRQKVIQLIKRNAAKSFDDGRTFIDRLFAIEEDKLTQVNHTETITDFQNLADPISPDLAKKLDLNLDPNSSLDLRQAHATLIKQQLNSEAKYIFLTGNPGIGKTTAIAQFLQNKEILEEGFLFFYVSPRKQVNLDIIDKFTDPTTRFLTDDRIFTINTNTEIIQNNNGNYTVEYLSNLYEEDFTQKTVQFLNQKTEREQNYYPSSSGFKRISEDQIQNRGKNNRGVLATICEAIYTLINRETSNNIIATVAIQSLKKTQLGKDTLSHFEKIFKNAYNDREGKVIPSKMRQLSNRVKHILIMIDEITGDDSGVEFLNRINEILNKYHLLKNDYGFNLKIIVADASIVDSNVIKQHLSETIAEPNKIFFRKASIPPFPSNEEQQIPPFPSNEEQQIPPFPSNEEQQIPPFQRGVRGDKTPPNNPLSIESFSYKKNPAVVINTNSYPASSLEINYKLFIKSSKFETDLSLKPKADLDDKVQEEISKHIYDLINEPETKQIIVYIQNKARLAELIDRIQLKQQRFQKYQDYLEIHASISEEEKKNIHRYQNQVKVIFMTASASRGLSFPKTTKILVDVPRFEIEKNLMEIIQVIYRGRGRDETGNSFDHEHKTLTFYLSESAFYYSDDPSIESDKLKQLSLQWSLVNVLNILLILKASIMTRIRGYGTIGTNQLLLIPIGGKSIFSAGQTFSSQMSTLINQLKHENRKHRDDEELGEVFQHLKELLNGVEILLVSSSNVKNQTPVSYLDLVESLTDQFEKYINQNLEQLLGFSTLEIGYINGSFLIIPVDDRTVKEKYTIQLSQQGFDREQLLTQLKDINNSPQYSDNLRSSVKASIDFLETLGDNHNTDITQRFEEESQYNDQYYAIPLFNLISYEIMKEYFNSEEKEPEDQTFRKILEHYLRQLYPVSDLLPIGDQYKFFPFLLFRSYSLKETRIKLFTDKYFLNSNELNILNLILYQEN